MRDPMDPDHQMGIIDYATKEDVEHGAWLQPGCVCSQAAHARGGDTGRVLPRSCRCGAGRSYQPPGPTAWPPAAVRKMDGSEFKNPFATATVRVTGDKNPPAGGYGAAANGGAHRPSHEGHHNGDGHGHRHARSSRRSRSRSRSASRSRSRSRSRSSSRSRSRSRSRSVTRSRTRSP